MVATHTMFLAHVLTLSDSISYGTGLQPMKFIARRICAFEYGAFLRKLSAAKDCSIQLITSHVPHHSRPDNIMLTVIFLPVSPDPH